MPVDSIYFSNYTRSGLAFMQYLITLCPNLPMGDASHGIQTRRRTMTVIRNPMDVCASSIINNYDNRQDINQTIKQEKHKYIKFYKELLKQDDLIVIDFNDLVGRPEETMKSVHKLLDLPFLMYDRDKDMTFTENGHLHTSKTHPEYDRIKDAVYQIPHPKSLEIYKQTLERGLRV
jgi:metallophosphoesterase superfamily enzyme